MKKVLGYIFLLIIFFVAITVSLTYVYKDKIIQHFIAQMNSQIGTPITVEKIDISFLDQMPYVSVVLHKVNIQESYQGSNESLLRASKIACALNPIDIITGDYSLHAITITDADIQLKIDAYNTPNYLIFKDKKGSDAPETVLYLKSIRLKNTAVSYQNSYQNHHISFQTEDLKSSMQVYGSVFYIESTGDALITNILVDAQSYLQGIRVKVVFDLVYNQYQHTIAMNPSTITYQNSAFDISGKYGFEDSQLSLSMNCVATKMTTLKELIPEQYLAKVKPYQYGGDVDFDLSVNGPIEKRSLPSTQLNFTLKNSIFSSTTHHTILENMALTGYFQNFPNDSLALTAISGDFNQRPFHGELLLTGFKNPKLNLAFDGAISGRTLQYWVDVPQIDSISGDIALDFTLVGKMSDLKNKKTIPNIHTSGDLSIAGLNISLANKTYPLEQMEGTFIFNNNDLAISSFSGRIRESDFELTGWVKNFLAFSMLENQPLGIEADLSARHINLDHLFTEHEFDEETDDSDYFAILPQLYLKLNCDIAHLQFRRFNGNHVTGDLTVKRNKASSNLIKINTMGGDITLSGDINAQPDSIFVTSNIHLSDIHIDSLFYVFENFDQDFLVDHHLKGTVHADIDNQIVFDRSLRLDLSSIRADIHTKITDGQLNNFEPMQELSKYLEKDKLDRLRFAQLTSDIHVENKTIYLPLMQVNSNVSNITIGGTHTFDQHIDYRVVAPLNNRKKVDKDAAFGTIEASQTGPIKIFLKITGTTDDFNISYDKSALKKAIVNDLKLEVEQLKEAFRKKGKKKKQEVDLEEEDYFDW